MGGGEREESGEHCGVDKSARGAREGNTDESTPCKGGRGT
jgi:hypothetical protein